MDCIEDHSKRGFHPFQDAPHIVRPDTLLEGWNPFEHIPRSWPQGPHVAKPKGNPFLGVSPFGMPVPISRPSALWHYELTASSSLFPYAGHWLKGVSFPVSCSPVPEERPPAAPSGCAEPWRLDRNAESGWGGGSLGIPGCDWWLVGWLAGRSVGRLVGFQIWPSNPTLKGRQKMKLLRGNQSDK